METLILHIPEDLRFSDEEFFIFCQENSEHFERTAQGDIILWLIQVEKQEK
jgi:hypothetical protein